MMQITFKASPALLRVEEVASSLIDADESLRQQIANSILSAVCDNNIPLRNKAGSRLPLHVLGDVASKARQVAADRTQKELRKFEARIKADAERDFADQVEQRERKRREWREAGMQAIAQPLESQIVKPEVIIQSSCWKNVREEHANRLAEGEPQEAKDWMKDRFRYGFVRLSEVVDWLRKEQGFDVTIVEPSIANKRANEADRQRFCNRIEQTFRERERADNDPKQIAERRLAWYNITLAAMMWWGLSAITPNEAATLLCRFNPHGDSNDPLSIITDETGPEDFKRLLRVFEDVERSQSQPRTLSDWHDVARDRRLKYHSWIDRFRQALTEIAPTTDTPVLVPDEAQEQTGTACSEASEVAPDAGQQGEATTLKQEQAIDHDATLAGLFNAVKVPQLETMFPDGGKWEKHAERANRNGLKCARTGRGEFNPYLAAVWWINSYGPIGWKWERCVRVLANNLPPRSLDSKHLLTGEFD